MSTGKIDMRLWAVALAFAMGLSATAIGQTARQPHRGTKKQRGEMAQAVVAPVAISEPLGHNPEMDMYEPRPGGIEESRKIKGVKTVASASNREAKRYAREERRRERKMAKEKLRKDRLAMGSRMTAMKNADPRKVSKANRR